MNKQVVNRLLLTVLIMSCTLAMAGVGINLVENGSFDDPENPLTKWKYDYSDTGNSNYADNHKYVSIVKTDGAHQNVLCLKADDDLLIRQGVKVDSAPIPVKPGGKYKVTASARSTGPGLRLLIEGYRWRPGIKPHKNPKLSEVRKCYKFRPIYFHGQKTGPCTKVGKSWSKASQTLPRKKLSKSAQKHFNKVQFLVVHIVAIDGKAEKGKYAYLYVDDIVIVRLN